MQGLSRSGRRGIAGLAALFAATAGAQAPNDYARGEAWLCRPGRNDACAVDLTASLLAANGSRTTQSFAADPKAPIDCFYVYPTVSRDTMPESDMVAGPEERDVVRTQFARFASVCRPYAPLYRQVTLAGLRPMLAPGGGGGEPLGSAQRVGYRDVVDAWNYYLQHDNQGRGVVLIGHSQGSFVLTTLLQQEVEGKPVASRLVSALILGSVLAVPRGGNVGGALKSTPLCRKAEQTGCVIAYASFRSTLPPPPNTLFGRVRDPAMEAACTNPAALGGGSGELSSYFLTDGRSPGDSAPPFRWSGTKNDITTPFVSLPHMVSAQCVSNDRGSYLEVTVRGDSTDPRTDDIPGDIEFRGRPLAQWGLHLVDVHLAIGNLVDVVRTQARAYAKRGDSDGTQAPAQVPRTASGRPDMNGIWQAMTTANWDIEPHVPRAAPALRPGPVVPVPAKEVIALGAVIAVPGGEGIVVGGTIPYTAEALARKRENQAQWLARDPEIRCYLPGVPRATYMPFPFQVFQSEKAFLIAYEYAGAVRNIFLKDPGEAPVDSWMGQSVGRWDGDTFVVTSTGFNDASWFDRAGNHHTEALKVTERFSMTTPYHIAYEATMEDPQTFTRPWTIRLTLYKNIDPNARLGQFKCTEFVEELLYGHLRKTPIKP